MVGLDSPSHWLILVAVVAVLFGYKKLPEMSRSLGRSLRIFKTEMKGLSEDDATRDAAKAATEVPVAPTAVEAPVAPPVVAAAPPVSVAPATVPVDVSTDLTKPAQTS